MTVKADDTLSITIKCNRSGKVWFANGNNTAYRINSLSGGTDGRSGQVNITMLKSGKLSTLAAGFVQYQFAVNDPLQGGYFNGEVRIVK